jgi:DNA-binding NarL/FixJ family response regulator
MISVLIADDQELIRESLELIISLDPRFKFVDRPRTDGKLLTLPTSCALMSYSWISACLRSTVLSA